MELDTSKAKQEFAIWPTDDDTAFARLRIWAGWKPEVVSPDAFCQIITGLSDNVFWDSYHQRDLLLVLAKRWPELSKESRMQIEGRLLSGPAKWKGEDDDSFEEHKAWATLDRLQWFVDKKCEFSVDVEAEIANRRIMATGWKPESAKHTTDSREIRCGFGARNTEYAVLLHEPIESLLFTASELSGRMEGNSLEERDPFAGLCAEHPVRAYRALVHAAQQKKFPEWAWKKFLDSESREKDKAMFSSIIADCLCHFPDEALTKLLHSSTYWLQRVSKRLSKHSPESFDKATSRLIGILQSEPSEGRSSVIRKSRGRDWVTEAFNSPTGYIVRTMFADSRTAAIHDDIEFAEKWLSQLVRLLDLSGDRRRHAIALISEYLGWLHRLDPEWTERHLLSILDATDEKDREVLWAGFLWNPKVTSPKLFSHLKPGLLTLSKERGLSREGHFQALAGLTLLGWISPSTKVKEEERWISSAEFRDVLLHGGDDFRSQILWQIEREFGDKDENTRKEWSAYALELFHDVWPRQKSVKNPTMSVRLYELLCSSGENFLELAEVVLPLLTKIDPGLGLRLHLQDEDSNIDKHPERFLKLLCIILSDEVSGWPYGIEDVLEKIGETDSNLLSDTRLQELKQKWNASVSLLPKWPSGQA